MNYLNSTYFGVNENGFSTLFGSMGTSSTAGTGGFFGGMYSSLGEYNNIRSGIYGTVLKAYYEKESSDGTSEKSSDKLTYTPAALNKEHSNVALTAKFKQSSAGAQKSLGSINEIDEDKTLSEQADGVKTAINSFVKDYNALIQSAANSSDENERGSSKLIDDFSKVLDTYQHSLEGIGLSVNSDGTLTVDTGTLDEKIKGAKDNEGKLDAIRSIFDTSKKYSFGSEVNKLLSSVHNATGAYINNNPSLYTNQFSNSSYSSSVTGSLFDSLY